MPALYYPFPSLIPPRRIDCFPHIQEDSVRTMLSAYCHRAKMGVIPAIMLAFTACSGLGCPTTSDSSAGPSPVQPATKEVVYAYVTNTFDNTVSTFRVDPATGDATAVAVTPVGRQPHGIVANEGGGRYLYVANSGDNTISQFRIDSDGVLHPLTPAVVTTASRPTDLAFNGTVLSVVEEGDKAVDTYHVNNDGTLGSSAFHDTVITPYAIDHTNGDYVIGSVTALYNVSQVASGPEVRPTFTKYPPTSLVAGVETLYVGDSHNEITTYAINSEGVIGQNLGVTSTTSYPIEFSIPPFNRSSRSSFLYVLTSDGAISKYDYLHLGSFKGTKLPTLIGAIQPPQHTIALKAYDTEHIDLILTITDQNNFQVFLSDYQIIPKLAFSAPTGKGPTAIAAVAYSVPVTTTPPAGGQINTTIK